MVRPMAGLFEFNDPGIAEVRKPPVVRWIRGPAFRAMKQKEGAVDRSPQRYGLSSRYIRKEREQMQVVIELPAPGTVFISCRPMDRQMTRLFLVKVGVFFLHAGERLFYRRVASGHSSGYGSLVGNPAPPMLCKWYRCTLGIQGGRLPKPFDRDDSQHLAWIKPGITERNLSPQGVGDYGDRLLSELMDQLRQIIDEGRHRIVGIWRPVAVAMPAQIGSDDVPAIAKFLRSPVPTATVVAPSMKEDQQRGVLIAPIGIVKPEPLGDEPV